MKKYYAFCAGGEMRYMGKFDHFPDADEEPDFDVIWVFDEETLRDLKNNIEGILK